MVKIVKIALIFSIILIIILPVSSSLFSAGGTPVNSQIFPSISYTPTAKWIFNSSFANYTVRNNGNSSFECFFISDVNDTLGTFKVTYHTDFFKGTFNSSFNKSYYFPGVNLSVLSYYNSGTAPPWFSHSNGTYSVIPGISLNTVLGTLYADQVFFKIETKINSTPYYSNGTNYIDRYSGIILKGNQSIHFGNHWENFSMALTSTNVPLGSPPPGAFGDLGLYWIIAGAAAVVTLASIFINAFRKRR